MIGQVFFVCLACRMKDRNQKGIHGAGYLETRKPAAGADLDLELRELRAEASYLRERAEVACAESVDGGHELLGVETPERVEARALHGYDALHAERCQQFGGPVEESIHGIVPLPR